MEKNIEVKDILNMKAEAIVLLHDLADVAREATMHAQRIHQNYKNAFGIGEDRIEVWADREGNNHEYLTHSGVWQARYLNQEYDVPCTTDAIFTLYRSEYMLKAGFVTEEADRAAYLRARQDKLIAEYFRSFISRSERGTTTKQLDAEGIFD